MIWLGASWVDRAQCCFCPNYCFVMSGSDGHRWCETCAHKAIAEGWAIMKGFPTIDFDHRHIRNRCPEVTFV